MGIVAIGWCITVLGMALHRRLATLRDSAADDLCVMAVASVAAPVLLAVDSGGIRSPVFALILAIPLGVWAYRKGFWSQGERASFAPFDPMEWVCLAVTGLALGAAVVSALAPATGWDATVAHLALPADYHRIGRIAPLPGNVYSGYPHLPHVFYTAAYASGLEKPAMLVGTTFAFLACLAVYHLGNALTSRRVGLIAMAILATSPVFVDQAGAPGVDLLFAAFTAMGLTGLALWRNHRQTPYLVFAALIVGASCGVRHTGLLVLVLLSVAVLLLGRERRLRHGALFAGVACLAAAPWLARAWWVTGNPVFPFLAEWFPSADFPHVGITGLGAHETVAQTGGIGLTGLLRFPWDIVMRPSQYDGWTKSPGVLVLALGVPGLFVGGRAARALGAFSGAGLAAFYVFQRFARYLLPFFVPMMVVAALAAERMPRLRRPVQALLLFTFAYGLVLHAAAIHFKVPVVQGKQTRDEYLTQRVERYPAFQWANRHLNDGGVILSPDQRSYYLDAPAFQNHWAMNALAEMTPEARRDWLVRHNIRYLMLPLGFLAEAHALAPFRPVVEAWRRDTAHFERLETLSVPKRDGGVERVEFYAFKAAQ
jgi:hypothetical protein